jgi:hypothetical protein
VQREHLDTPSLRVGKFADAAEATPRGTTGTSELPPNRT